MARRRSAGPVSPPAVSALIAVSRSVTGVLASLTLYAAPCLSGGAVAALFHEPLRLDLTTAFTLGFFVPVGPVYLVYASGWGMRRTLAQVADWEQTGLIDFGQAEQLRRRAISWYIARRF